MTRRCPDRSAGFHRARRAAAPAGGGLEKSRFSSDRMRPDARERLCDKGPCRLLPLTSASMN